ncbi:MAG: radical SAM protein, partial [bacterium]
KNAGLTSVAVSIPHIFPDEYDAITGYSGGLPLALKGIKNSIAEGLHTTVRFILTPSLTTEITALIAFIHEHLKGVTKLELVFPEMYEHHHVEQYDFNELENALRMLNEKTGDLETPLAFSHLWGLPPCVFSDSGAFSGIFALEAGSELPWREKTKECNTCVLLMCCPGLPVSFRKKIIPITSHSSFTAFRVKSDVEYKSIANFCTPYQVEGAEGKPVVNDALLRINYHCNQRCRFCWIEPGYTNLPHEAVVEKITELGKTGLKVLTITGGEPTLNSRLVEYVRLAKESGVKTITLQTNAARLENNKLCQRLSEAGLDSVFVSLHAHSAEISDSITGAPGTFEKTLQGIENLLECDLFLSLSFVINTLNFKIIPEYVEFVNARLGKVPVIFSFVAPLYDALMHKGIVPRFSDIKEYLKRAIGLCVEKRVPYSGLASMCGIPPCGLDGDMQCFPDLQKVVPQGSEFDFIKLPDCVECSFNEYCFGMRRQYVNIYGTDEMRPIKVASVKITKNFADLTPAEFFQKVLFK